LGELGYGDKGATSWKHFYFLCLINPISETESQPGYDLRGVSDSIPLSTLTEPSLPSLKARILQSPQSLTKISHVALGLESGSLGKKSIKSYEKTMAAGKRIYFRFPSCDFGWR
jgi:hypothetical protein